MIGPSLLLNKYCLRGHGSNPPLRDTRASIEDGDLENRAHNRRGPVDPPTYSARGTGSMTWMRGQKDMLIYSNISYDPAS